MTHALGVAPVSPVRVRADASAAALTELLLGEGATVRDAVGDFVAIQTSFDGVVGWVQRDALLSVDVHYHDSWLLNAAWCGGGSLAVHDQLLSLPLRSRLLLDGAERVRLPGGASARLVAGQVVSLGVTSSTARLMSPAEWAWRHFEGAAVKVGGITPLGTDASGMVQTTFLARGRPLPRDVVEQSREGVAVDVTEIESGDVIYLGRTEDDPAMEALVIASAHHLIRANEWRGVVAREEWDGRRVPHAHGRSWMSIRRFL